MEPQLSSRGRAHQRDQLVSTGLAAPTPRVGADSGEGLGVTISGAQFRTATSVPVPVPGLTSARGSEHFLISESYCDIV